MANELKILIHGQLNEKVTTQVMQKQLEDIGKKLKVTIGIDDKQLSKIADDIKKLQSQIENKKVNLVTDKDVSNVKEFYSSIDKAVEEYSKLGKVKIDKTLNPATKEAEKFQLTIKKSTGEVEKLKFELASLKGIQGVGGFALTGRSVSTPDTTVDQFKNISTESQKATKHVGNFGSAMGNTFSKMPVYMAASAIMFTPFIALNSFVDTLYEIDERLVSIDKVMDNADMSAVFERASISAAKFGQKITDSLEVLEEISKLGFSENDASILSDNAMLLSTVGEFKSNTEAATGLVAIMKQYKLEIADTIDVVNALNSVSNQTGTDTVNLTEGISKASSAASMAKVSFHELSGMISTTQEILKISGSEAGTFYKQIFTRYLRPDTLKAIEAIGVKTRETSGELRSATEVFKDLGEAFKTLDSQTKNSVAMELGGSWHINKTISLLENQESVLKNTGFSINSYNSAVEELQTFQEGLRFETNLMIGSFQNLNKVISDSGGRDGVVAFLKTVTSLTNGFANLTEATNGMNIKLPLLAGLVWGSVKAFGALKLAMTGVKMSAGWIGAALVGVELLASAFMSSKASAEMNTEALTENAKKTNEQTVTLSKLVNRYKELEPQAENNTAKQEELNGVLQKINELAPHLIDSTGKYGDALTLNKQKADDYIRSLQGLTAEQIQQAKTANSIEVSAINVDIEKLKSELSNAEGLIKETLDGILDYQKSNNVKGLSDAEKEFNSRLRQLQQESGKALESGNTKLYNSIVRQISVAEQGYRQYVELMKQSEGDLTKHAEKINKLHELEGKKEGLELRSKALDDVTSRANDNSDALGKVGNAASDASAGIDELTDSEYNASLAIEDNTKKADKLVETYEGAISSISSLNSAVEELDESHNVSSKTISFLMERYPSLLAHIDDEKTLRKLLQEEIEKETLTARQAMIDKLADSETFYNNMLKNNAEAVKTLNEHYKVDLSQYKSLGEAKLEVDNRIRNRINEAWEKFHKKYKDTIIESRILTGELKADFKMKDTWIKDASENAKVDLNDIALKTVIPITSSIPNSGKKDDKKTDKGNKGDKKPKPQKPVSQYLSSEFDKNTDKYNDQLDASEHKLAKLKETSEAYRSELQNQLTITRNIMKVNSDEIGRLKNRNATLSSLIKGMGDYNKLSNEEKELYNKRKKELDDNEKSINSLTKSNRDYTQSLTDINKSIDESKIAELADKQEKAAQKVENAVKKINSALGKYDYQMARSKSIQSLFEEGDAEWVRELEFQNKLLAEKAEAVLKERDALQQALKTEELSAEKKAELKERIDELSLSYWDLQNAIQDTGDALKNVLSNKLTALRDEYMKSLKDELDTQTKALEDSIKKAEEYYDNLIEKQNERLKALDEEIEKEDRLKKLRDIADEIANVKADKRFELITEDGRKILTYDTAKVAELEKQQNELVKQYEREDLKTSIRNEIDRLEKAKNDELKIAQEKIEQLKIKYDEQVKLEDTRWDTVLKSVQNGTFNLDEFMNGWYGNNLSNLSTYVSNLETMIQQIKNAYSSLASLSVANAGVPNIPTPSPTQSSGGGKNTPHFKEYHKGGIVGGNGSKLAEVLNSFANLQPNEQYIKALRGEVMIPETNIPRFIHNIGKAMIPDFKQSNKNPQSGDTFNINKLEVVANNAMDLMKSLKAFKQSIHT
jgi:TP901 family phage tail tape measure protein